MRLFPFAARFAFFLSLSFAFLSGCSTELDSNADYKEVLVVYSVLDASQTTHYAKVNKAFLNTNSNALTIAANNPDSTQYGEELRVVLQQLRSDSSVVTEHAMERFISTGKEPGTFFSGDQVLYRTTGTVQLDEQAIYRVVATNTKTGITAYGATPLVKENAAQQDKGFCIFQISRAFAPSKQCWTENQPSAFEPEFPSAISYFIAENSNARIFTIKLTFKFWETTDGVREEKQVDWYIRNNFIQNPGSNQSVALEKDFFITNLLALIDRSGDNATTKREPGDVYVTITGGSASLETYYRINNSFSLISQTRPEYDNITNGTGLVASRRSKTARGFLTSNAIKYLQGYPELKFKP